MPTLAIKDKLTVMTRWPSIPILILACILMSLFFTACRSRQDIILDYHDKTSSIADEYLEIILGIVNEEIQALDNSITLNDLKFKANWLREMESSVQELKHDLRLLEPPDELQEVHNKALFSFDRAAIGITQLVTVYEGVINSPTTPLLWEDLKIGLDTIGVSIDIWQTALLEMNEIIANTDGSKD
jgi:hypothetical protein